MFEAKFNEPLAGIEIPMHKGLQEGVRIHTKQIKEHMTSLTLTMDELSKLEYKDYHTFITDAERTEAREAMLTYMLGELEHLMESAERVYHHRAAGTGF
jgi:hypothetical protein